MNKAKILLFLTATILITLFSTCSPLYPLNPWDDANCFLTIGKAMLHGKEVYRDIFDQKGPILFFIHEWAAWRSYNSFFGIYIVEVLAYWGYLWYSYKIMRLFSDSNITLPLTMLIGLVVLTTDFFFYGDSVEEFSLPILSHSLFVMLRYVKKRQLPSFSMSLVMGIGIGIVFWMKFTILVFYLGALCALLFIAWHRRELENVCRIIGWTFLGFSCVSMAVLLYFIVHGTLYDLWDAYFYTNMFMYGGSSSNGAPEGVGFWILKFTLWMVLVLPIACMRIRWDIKILVVAAYGMQMLSFALFAVHIYYFLVCFTFAPLVIYFCRGKVFSLRMAVGFAFIALVATAKSFNLMTLVMGNFQQTVLECAKIVVDGCETGEDVLTFSSHETGIYQTIDQLPPNKYFFASNLCHEGNKAEQAEVVATGKVKYLIRKIDPVKTTLEFYQAPIPEQYTLCYTGNELFRYHLLLNPKMFFWNLGWPQPIMRLFTNGDNAEQQQILLYKRN